MQHANDKLSRRVILRAAPSAQPTSSTDATTPLLRRLVKGSRGAAVAAATAPPVPAANDQGGAGDWVGMELMRGLLNYRAPTPPFLSAFKAERGERYRRWFGGCQRVSQQHMGTPFHALATPAKPTSPSASVEVCLTALPSAESGEAASEVVGSEGNGALSPASVPPLAATGTGTSSGGAPTGSPAWSAPAPTDAILEKGSPKCGNPVFFDIYLANLLIGGNHHGLT